MSGLRAAVHLWLSSNKVARDAHVTAVDIASGVAIGRRTGVAHYVADAAEITVGDKTVLATHWLCGAKSVDAATHDDLTVECVGCRLAAALPSGPCVYYAWGDDDELLYVGSTINPPQRIRAHSTQTDWWSEVRRLTFDQHETEQAARHAEYVAIGERPGVYNKASRRDLYKSSGSDLLRLVEGGESA